jgi:NADPH:quinone reductase-like Zn-dependent oxidoreductase
MKAVVISEHGDESVLRLEDRPRPAPAADEVLVRVRAVGVNHLDLWVRRGIPGVRYPLPIIPGCEVAGVIEEAGPAARGVKPGDEIVAAPGLSCNRCRECVSGNEQLCRHYGILGETRDGGCAEYMVIPAVNALPRPMNLSFEQVAAMPLVFLTAWHMLVDRARLRPGETVLVHAAGSGVGSAAIQVARLHHARVIATAGSDEKLAKARDLGADETVNYSTPDWVAQVRRLTAKRGADVVVEHVGAATWEGSEASLAKGGRLVTCGATSGHEVTVNLRRLFFKGLSILGSTMGSRAEVMEVLAHAGAGRLRPVIDRVLPLSEVQQAHRLIERREQFGKVVLSVGSEEERS